MVTSLCEILLIRFACFSFIIVIILVFVLPSPQSGCRISVLPLFHIPLVAGNSNAYSLLEVSPCVKQKRAELIKCHL